MSEETKTEVEIDVTPEEVKPEVIGVTLGAVKLICDVIDTCSRRGAFIGDELATVGALYNQLKQHLPKEEESTEEEQLELPLEDKK